MATIDELKAICREEIEAAREFDNDEEPYVENGPLDRWLKAHGERVKATHPVHILALLTELEHRDGRIMKLSDQCKAWRDRYEPENGDD